MWVMGKPRAKCRPCANLANLVQTSCQTSCKPHADLVRCQPSVQTLCKPHADLVQTSYRPCANLMQTSCKPHANLMQTSCRPRANANLMLPRARPSRSFLIKLGERVQGQFLVPLLGRPWLDNKLL